MKKRVMKISSLLLMAGIVSACSVLPGIHTTDIIQGNNVEENRLEQIKPGMPKAEVQRILGTPLVHDAFHPNIWYYTYLHTLSTGKEVERNNVTIIFDKNNKVQSVNQLQ